MLYICGDEEKDKWKINEIYIIRNVEIKRQICKFYKQQEKTLSDLHGKSRWSHVWWHKMQY